MHNLSSIGGLTRGGENFISHDDNELAQLARILNSSVEGTVADKSASKRY